MGNEFLNFRMIHIFYHFSLIVCIIYLQFAFMRTKEEFEVKDGTHTYDTKKNDFEKKTHRLCNEMQSIYFPSKFENLIDFKSRIKIKIKINSRYCMIQNYKAN